MGKPADEDHMFAPVHKHESRVCNKPGSWHNPTGELLRKVHDDVWVVERGYVTGGLDGGAKTTVIRLEDGRLFIHSPLPLNAELKTAVDALGNVSAIVAPNNHHVSFVGSWSRHYPNAAVLAPPGLRVSRNDLPFTDELDQTGEPHPSFADDAKSIRPFHVTALTPMNETIFFHEPSRTLLSTDIIMNFPRNVPFGTRFIDFLTAKVFKPLMHRSSTKDVAAFNETLDRIEGLGFTTLIPCHGHIATENALEVFKRARARSFGSKK